MLGGSVLDFMGARVWYVGHGGRIASAVGSTDPAIVAGKGGIVEIKLIHHQARGRAAPLAKIS
jgi:hypothetical protein